jgi:hypothetical protein
MRSVILQIRMIIIYMVTFLTGVPHRFPSGRICWHHHMTRHRKSKDDAPRGSSGSNNPSPGRKAKDKMKKKMAGF